MQRRKGLFRGSTARGAKRNSFRNISTIKCFTFQAVRVRLPHISIPIASEIVRSTWPIKTKIRNAPSQQSVERHPARCALLDCSYVALKESTFWQGSTIYVTAWLTQDRQGCQ